MKKNRQNIESNRQIVKRYFDTLLVKYENLIECFGLTSEFEMIQGNLIDTISMRRHKQVLFALKAKGIMRPNRLNIKL